MRGERSHFQLSLALVSLFVTVSYLTITALIIIQPALSPLRFEYFTAMARNAKLFFKAALYVPFLACVVNAQSSGSKEFYDACAKGDLESVKEYIENDPCT